MSVASHPSRLALIGAAVSWAGPALAAVTSREEMWRVMGGRIRHEDPGDLTWFFVAAGALVLCAALLARFYSRRSVRSSTRRARHTPDQPSFSELARALGLRRLEVTNLRKIATRLSGGGDPAGLLSAPSGRQYLGADLRKRIRRRQREVAMLERMLERLDTSSERDFHERDSLRVEVDIPIWLVKKVPGDSPVEDEVVVDIVPVSGRLEDLSEGGAEVCAAIPLAGGDLVEFWSADSRIWLPPIQAGVVAVEPDGGGTTHVHLHFLDPPLTDVRKAIQEIQRLELEELDDAEGDPGVEAGEHGAAD